MAFDCWRGWSLGLLVDRNAHSLSRPNVFSIVHMINHSGDAVLVCDSRIVGDGKPSLQIMPVLDGIAEDTDSERACHLGNLKPSVEVGGAEEIDLMAASQCILLYATARSSLEPCHDVMCCLWCKERHRPVAEEFCHLHRVTGTAQLCWKQRTKHLHSVLFSFLHMPCTKTSRGHRWPLKRIRLQHSATREDVCEGR